MSANSTLIHADGHVLAAVDPSVYADSVVDYAAWAAAAMSAPLELLHTLERQPTQARGDLSGNLSMDNQETLLGELAELDERRARLSQEHGRVLLEHARNRLAESHPGLTVELRQRHGSLPDTLVDLETDVRLLVLGKRGEHADFATGHLGSNLERVVRSVHRPVLVAARTYRPVTRFMIAFDGSATTRKCVDMVCASTLLKQAACDILMVGMSDDAHVAALEQAISQLQEAGFQPRRHVVDGSADTVITEQVEALGVDLLVMGAYGHSRIRNLIVGSTTTQILRTCHIPVLLLR